MRNLCIGFVVKTLAFALCLGIACLLAALYGALHNQISYTVGPSYFVDLKFAQFRIPDAYHNRLGAAWVGVQASWWMGLIIGTPIGFLTLFLTGFRKPILAFSRLAAWVIAVTLAAGCAALAVSMFTINAGNVPVWIDRFRPSDPVGFARAGTMHDYSYLGGILGLLLGLILAIRQIVLQRRRSTAARV